MRIELPHDKTNKMTVRPTKTQISLGICPVWSESSICAHWVAEDPVFLHADNEDSDQTGCMPRLNWVFAGRTSFCCFFSWGGSYVKTILAEWQTVQDLIRQFLNNVLVNVDCIRPKQIYVCFRFPDPTYVFGPTLNIYCDKRKKKERKKK